MGWGGEYVGGFGMGWEEGFWLLVREADGFVVLVACGCGLSGLISAARPDGL